MTSRLIFTPGKHTYSLDGKRVQGVTTVIRRATEKPGLAWSSAEEAAVWALGNRDAVDRMGEALWIKTARAAHRVAWDAAARRGTFLHDAARQLVTGQELIPVDMETGEEWPQDVQMAAAQLAQFMDDFRVQPVHIERPVFHEVDRWAGTLDLVADLADGRRWLLDYKTGKSGVYPDHAIQQAAYRHATHIQVEIDGHLSDQPMTHTDAAGIIWVRPDGYELRPVQADDYSYSVFRHMQQVAAWAAMPPEATVWDPLPVIAS